MKTRWYGIIHRTPFCQCPRLYTDTLRRQGFRRGWYKSAAQLCQSDIEPGRFERLLKTFLFQWCIETAALSDFPFFSVVYKYSYLLTYLIKYRRYSLLAMQIKSDISTNKALKASKPSCTESANIKQNCVYLLQSLPGRRWRMSVSGRACPWSLYMPPGWTDDGMPAETPQDDHLDTTGCNRNLCWDTNCTHTAFRLPAAIYCPLLMSGQPLWRSYHHGPASTAYWQGACGQL